MIKHILSISALSLLFCITLHSQSITLPNKEKIDINKLSSILNEDVFSYFNNETQQYNTSLKKELFSKTEEYAKYIAKLKELKNTISTNDLEYKLPIGEFELSDYNIDTNTFLFTTVSTYYWNENMYHILKNNIVAANIDFKKEKIPNDFLGRFKYIYPIPCEIDKALYVENARNGVLQFTLTIEILSTLPIPSETNFSETKEGIFVIVKKITVSSDNKTILEYSFN